MPYKLDGRTLQLDRAFTDSTGVQRPANWLRLSTERDRELLGITWEAPTDVSYDQRFYWGPSNPKQLNDEPAVDEDGNELGYTQTGLKTLWKGIQEETASKLLAPSDWRVVKELEVNSSFSAAKSAYPTKWQTYRAAVRTACNTRQAEIDACSSVEALKELLFPIGGATITRQQRDAEGNGVVDDDGNPVMETVANPDVATAWPDPVE